MLARSPKEIRIGDIIRALEGPITPVDCLSQDKRGDKCCRDPDHCRTRFVWEKLRDKINDVLDSITLEDIMGWNPLERSLLEKNI